MSWRFIKIGECCEWPAAEFLADLATPDSRATAFVVAAPAAASKLKSGGGQAEQKLVDELKKYVTDNKIRYKALAEVEFLEAIPKTPSGKLLRKDCASFIAFARVAVAPADGASGDSSQCEPCTRNRSRSAARSSRFASEDTADVGCAIEYQVVNMAIGACALNAQLWSGEIRVHRGESSRGRMGADPAWAVRRASDASDAHSELRKL